jgi:aminoglycoside phosphotransferase (APT) family kinase protein
VETDGRLGIVFERIRGPSLLRVLEERPCRLFESAAALPDGDRLCHGDFHPGKVLVSDRGLVVIDWMTGSRGCPAADIARTELIIATGNLPPAAGPAARALLSSARSVLIARYLRGYRRATPRESRETAPWSVPIAAARLFEVVDYPAELRAVMKRIDRRRDGRPRAAAARGAP